MVNIAIAGGTGELAREVIDALVASTTKHFILILSRSPPTVKTNPHNLPFENVNYSDLSSLTRILADNKIHTVLSFIQLLHDTDNTSQRNLIDACVQAGVSRFAPSEYGGVTSSSSLLPGWKQKHDIAGYLANLATSNTGTQPRAPLEYTLFHPSLLTNYLAYPHRTSPHVTPLQTPFVNIPSRRAIMIEHPHDPFVTFTTVQDLARVVRFAVEFSGTWPKVGGIRGQRVRLSELVGIAEKVTGDKFQIDTVNLQDLKSGKWNATASFGIEASHPSASQLVDQSNNDQQVQMQQILNQVMTGILLGAVEDGCWDVSDEWNQIIDEQQQQQKSGEQFKFTGVEEFLEKYLK
ncbi:NAD(P)-binding protein [Cladorrhinum sp. PSN259]|nr:NAD(P)-binding protein [Cladorrhinum sp. PSN259]